MHIGKWLLRSSNIFCNFFTNIIFFYDFIFHASEIRTVLLEVSIDLGLLKKSLLKTSKIVLMFSNSFARHFSSMVYAKCLLPRLDRLLLVRSCLQNFYQCTIMWRQCDIFKRNDVTSADFLRWYNYQYIFTGIVL